MHEEVLTKKATAIFPRLATFKDFYLAGGTSLALQIGHRVSVDFDMFTQRPLPRALLKKIKQTFRDSTVIVTYSAPDQMNLQIDGIKYTFFFYEYSLIEKTKQFKGVPLASVLEIATMKAFSIGKRLSYKDYVDWYFLLTGSHVTLDQVIQSAKKKFAHDFNDRLFLGQLVSMSDIATQKIDFVGKEISKNQIETCLKKSVREFV